MKKYSVLKTSPEILKTWSNYSLILLSVMPWSFLSWCKEKSLVKFKKKELSKEKSKFCALVKCYKTIRRNDRNDRNLFGENHNLENWSLFMDIRFLVSHLLSGVDLIHGESTVWDHNAKMSTLKSVVERNHIPLLNGSRHCMVWGT